MSKLYIDKDGVQRGYYVYVHKDVETDKVFYVGKGQGRRAWSDRRSQYWKDAVAKLKQGWDVEIVADDLSEDEAFELEAKTVESHGGDMATGGVLANWIPGGEHPVSVTFSIPLPESSVRYQEVYNKERKFKSLPRIEQEVFSKSLKANLEEMIADFTDEGDDETEAFHSENLISMLEGIAEEADRFLRRRISFHKFCLIIESEIEQIEFERNYQDEDDPMTETDEKAYDSAKVLLSVKLANVDSGNKIEAVTKAEKATQDL